MPATKPRKVPTPRDRGVAQVRTIARRANMPVNHCLMKLRAGGVKALDGGSLYASSKVDLDSAIAALNQKAEDIEAEKPKLAALAEAASRASGGIEPAKVAYTGDDDQPQPQFIAESADPSVYMDFPPIINPDPDKVYRPVNMNPDRQHRMISRGYQFVKDKAHIARIGQGTLERYINGRGRVQFKDRELAFISLDLAKRRQAERHRLTLQDRADIEESFAANVDATRRRLGVGADAKLEAFDMPLGEAEERAEHAEAVRRGVQRVVLDLGGKPRG